MPDRNKSLEQMLGEFLREIGVLVLVFFGLSAMIDVKGLDWLGLIRAIVGVLIGTDFWMVGVNVERMD